ncbi:MAG: 30S ribosomal protein S4e [Methermicoccaceae archaeon]
MSGHQKAVSAPKSWRMSRKMHKWVAKPVPGPHSKHTSITLLMVLRDILGIVDNAREAKRALHEGNVLVDGRIRKEPKFPVGVFDVISIPKLEKRYRVLVDTHGRMDIVEDMEQELVKLYKVKNKRTVAGGKIQLNLHDGTNILVGDDTIKPADSVLLSLPDKSVITYVPFKKGVLAYVTWGKHAGQLARVKDIHVFERPIRNTVRLEVEGVEVETVMDYVFALGKEEQVLHILPSSEEHSEEVV